MKRSAITFALDIPVNLFFSEMTPFKRVKEYI